MQSCTLKCIKQLKHRTMCDDGAMSSGFQAQRRHLRPTDRIPAKIHRAPLRHDAKVNMDCQILGEICTQWIHKNTELRLLLQILLPTSNDVESPGALEIKQLALT